MNLLHLAATFGIKTLEFEYYLEYLAPLSCFVEKFMSVIEKPIDYCGVCGEAIYSNQYNVHQCPSTRFCSASEVFFGRDGGRIGGQYLKVMYKEYTSASFTTAKPQTADSQHLALFGMDWNLVPFFLFGLCTLDLLSSDKAFQRPPSLSICPGPVLRAEEGDTIKVTLMNKADRNYSIQPHGLFYESLNNGDRKETASHHHFVLG